eukprot:gene11075-3781_t
MTETTYTNKTEKWTGKDGYKWTQGGKIMATVEEIKIGKVRSFPKEFKNNKKEVFEILKIRPLWYKYISSELKEDEQIVKLDENHVDLKMKLMKNGTFVLLGPKYIDDESMMEYTINTSPTKFQKPIFKMMHENSIKIPHNLAKNVLMFCPYDLCNEYSGLSEEIQQNEEVLLKLCFASINGLKKIKFTKEAQRKMIQFYPPLIQIFPDFIDNY